MNHEPAIEAKDKPTVPHFTIKSEKLGNGEYLIRAYPQFPKSGETVIHEGKRAIASPISDPKTDAAGRLYFEQLLMTWGEAPGGA